MLQVRKKKAKNSRCMYISIFIKIHMCREDKEKNVLVESPNINTKNAWNAAHSLDLVSTKIHQISTLAYFALFNL